MTAPAEQLCGHRWSTRHGCARLPEAGVHGGHRCDLPADHHDDEPATSCRCRCGATTARLEGER